MEKLELTKLEMHLLTLMCSDYVDKFPIRDERSQQRREELATKLADMNGKVQEMPGDVVITISANTLI